MVTPLIHRFEQVLGPLEHRDLSQVVRDQIRELVPRFQSADWLYRKGRREAGRNIKIATGVNVIQRMHKARGGLIRATVEVAKERWQYVSLSGDFFCHPRDAIADLESALVGTPCLQVSDVVAQFYATHDIETPGVSVDDWVEALPIERKPESDSV